MPIEWVRIKDTLGKTYTYSTKHHANAESIRITEDKITIGMKRSEDGIPTHLVFLKQNIVHYEYTSDHLQKQHAKRGRYRH